MKNQALNLKESLDSSDLSTSEEERPVREYLLFGLCSITRVEAKHFGCDKFLKNMKASKLNSKLAL